MWKILPFFVLYWSVFGSWRQLTGQAISKQTILNGYFFKISVPLFGLHILAESIKSKSKQRHPPVLNKYQSCSPKICTLNSFHGRVSFSFSFLGIVENENVSVL